MMETCITKHQFLMRIAKIMEANLHDEQFGISKLARETGTSCITFHRKLNSISKISANQFIFHIRLKKHRIFETIRGEPEFQKFIKDSDIHWHPEMKKIDKILKKYRREN